MSDTLPPRHTDITSDPPVHTGTPVSSATAATDAKKTISPVTGALHRRFSPCGRIALYKPFGDSIAASPITGQPVATTAYSSPNGDDYIVTLHLVPVTEKSREEFKLLKAASDAVVGYPLHMEFDTLLLQAPCDRIHCDGC